MSHVYRTGRHEVLYNEHTKTNICLSRGRDLGLGSVQDIKNQTSSLLAVKEALCSQRHSSWGESNRAGIVDFANDSLPELLCTLSTFHFCCSWLKPLEELLACISSRCTGWLWACGWPGWTCTLHKANLTHLDLAHNVICMIELKACKRFAKDTSWGLSDNWRCLFGIRLVLTDAELTGLPQRRMGLQL